MAKVPFTKLSLSKNNEIKQLEWKEQKIEIKQYLPIAEKLNLIARIVNFSVDEHVFYNPCKIEIFELIEIIFAYTNINLTEKQSEDILKLYDLLFSSGFANKVKENIPKEELEYINIGVWNVINEIYRYRDSAMGIMEQITTDQQMTEDGLNDIINTLKTSPELHHLEEITTQLG